MIDKKLSALVTRIPEMAAARYWNSSEQSTFQAAILRYGADAIPFLLPYLKHPQSKVRYLTAEIMERIQGLNASHLDALIAYGRMGEGLLSMAIARIGTPKAVAFLAAELQCANQESSPLGAAFEFLGKKGVPALCHLVRSTPSIDNSLEYELYTLMRRLDSGARNDAVDLLLNIVMDQSVARSNRRSAIRILGKLGGMARRCVPVLKRLAQQEPDIFQEPVEDALVNMGVSDAVSGLLQDLARSGNDTDKTLRDLGSLGRQGISAGPEVVRYFENPDWDIRRTAVQVVGFIGYREAVPSLIRFLASEADWQLVWVSIESLVLLRAIEAQDALRKVADRYWFPPVQRMAQEAVMQIQKSSSTVMVKHWPRRYSGSFSYYAPLPWKQTPPAPENGIGSRLDVPDGEFNGRDDGEWGGNLTFVAKDGTKRMVLDNNIQAITRFGTGIFALSGLAHLSINEGSVYRVTRDATGAWTAIRWRRLPGAPEWAVVQETTGNGQILRVACDGGTVDISPEGAMRFIG